MAEQAAWLKSVRDMQLPHLEGFTSRLPNFPVGVAQHAHQTVQQLGKVLQHVDVRHAGKDADPADQKLSLVRVDHRQVFSQLWDELIQVQSVAGRHYVLRTATAGPDHP